MLKIQIKLVTISISIISILSFNLSASAKQIHLIDGSWNPGTKQKLEKLLNENANKGKKVVFDFDNTTVSRDIADATFAYLVKEKKIDINLIKSFSPDFTLDGKEVSVSGGVDLTEYYEKIQDVTSYDKNDTSPALNGYAWVVQAMEGKTPFDVTEASRNAFMGNKASMDRKLGIETTIEVTPGKTSYRVPFYHPETVDLIGNLIMNGYDVYVISATSVWSVRYMITVELPKLLYKEFGKKLSIKPEKVFGLSTLLKDKRNGQLYKDSFLVKVNKKYAGLDPEELQNYQLTNQMVGPLSGYEGKTSTIQKFITKENEKPFLVCGDSPGDFSMLNFSENRLWFSRLESFDYQKKLLSRIKKSELAHWFIQPVLYKKNPGLVKNISQLKLLLKTAKDYTKAMESANIWTKSTLLKDFEN